MDTNVIVIGDESGNIIYKSSNPEYGYIKVRQKRAIFTDNGFVEMRTLQALINGSIETLKDLNLKAGDELKGKIIIRETLEPFNKKDPDKHLKIAGSTGIICSIDGEPIYRRSFYTTNEEATDELISHDNSEEIKEAYAIINDDNIDANQNFGKV